MPISTDTETIPDRASGSPGARHAARIAAAAHDLRSPLNAILGWAKLLAMKHGADPDIAAIAERIERSGRSQLKVIEELDALAGDEG
jgi:signal transduction histidine kinase